MNPTKRERERESKRNSLYLLAVDAVKVKEQFVERVGVKMEEDDSVMPEDQAKVSEEDAVRKRGWEIAEAVVDAAKDWEDEEAVD